ncbi:MAG: hypothetical protein WC709_01805 [Thermoleophilia bacterium]
MRDGDPSSGPRTSPRGGPPAGGLTYHQVLAAGREAHRRSENDEFVYLPPGITFWRSLRPGGPSTYSCSLPVKDRTLPGDGWQHAQPCDCPYCRPAP